MKTYYLWDIANTVFIENWNKELSGYNSYDEYIESLCHNLNSITPLQYEELYKKPYEDGLYDLILPDNLIKTLEWTKYNGLFTTGVKQQTDWRHKQIMRKYGVDVRPLFMNIFSTFDYAPVNKKTKDMLMDVIDQIISQGFDRLVYTDDKQENCEFFVQAVEVCQTRKSDFSFVVYNINYSSKQSIKISDVFYKICSLDQLVDNEKSLLNL